MAVNLIGQKAMNTVVSHHAVTQAAIHEQTAEVEARAKANLAKANKTHRITLSGYFPAFIDSDFGDVDGFVNLNAPDAVALEFGHAPSGFFAGTKTKAPDGLYILSMAAGLI